MGTGAQLHTYDRPAIRHVSVSLTQTNDDPLVVWICTCLVKGVYLPPHPQPWLYSTRDQLAYFLWTFERSAEVLPLSFFRRGVVVVEDLEGFELKNLGSPKMASELFRSGCLSLLDPPWMNRHNFAIRFPFLNATPSQGDRGLFPDARVFRAHAQHWLGVQGCAGGSVFLHER